MKKKLRELRRKRIFVKLCKGALRISHTYGLFRDTCTIKKKGNNSRFKKGLDFVALLCLSKKINRYSKAKVKAKAKKRGGKNDK